MLAQSISILYELAIDEQTFKISLARYWILLCLYRFDDSFDKPHVHTVLIMKVYNVPKGLGVNGELIIK